MLTAGVHIIEIEETGQRAGFPSKWELTFQDCQISLVVAPVPVLTFAFVVELGAAEM